MLLKAALRGKGREKERRSGSSNAARLPVLRICLIELIDHTGGRKVKAVASASFQIYAAIRAGQHRRKKKKEESRLSKAQARSSAKLTSIKTTRPERRKGRGLTPSIQIVLIKTEALMERRLEENSRGGGSQEKDLHPSLPPSAETLLLKGEEKEGVGKTSTSRFRRLSDTSGFLLFNIQACSDDEGKRRERRVSLIRPICSIRTQLQIMSAYTFQNPTAEKTNEEKKKGARGKREQRDPHIRCFTCCRSVSACEREGNSLKKQKGGLH